MSATHDRISVTCPECGHVSRTSRANIGKSGKCACGAHFVVAEQHTRTCPFCGQINGLAADTCSTCGQNFAVSRPARPESRSYPYNGDIARRPWTRVWSIPLVVVLVVVILAVLLAVVSDADKLRSLELVAIPLAFLLAWGLMMGWIGSAIGGPRGHSTAGVLLSLFLGPLGWLIAAVLPRTPEAEARHYVAVQKRIAMIEQQDE